MMKRVLSLFLALVLLVGLCPPITAGAADTVGPRTDFGVEWSYREGVLTFSSGELPETADDFPWMEYANKIDQILITAQVSGTSMQALAGLGDIKRLVFQNAEPATDDVENFWTEELLYPDTWPMDWECSFADAIYAYSPDRMGFCGAQDEQGEYGANLAWRLEDGTLTISGEGAMADWSFGEQAPWAVYCDEIERVVIEDGVSTVGDRAFGIGDGVIPMSIIDSGEPFAYHFSSVTLGSDLERIGSYAFAYCDALTEIALPENLKAIGEAAFANCVGLTQAAIPGAVEVIGNRAFYRCTGLTQVTFAPDLTLAGMREAFIGCTGLTEVEIPATMPGELESIRYSGAFTDCTNLQNVTFRSGAVIVDSRMFDGCSSLKTVDIPHSVAQVYNTAFLGCTSLTDIQYDGYPDEWDAILVEEDPAEDVWPSGVVVHCLEDTQPPAITAVTASGIHNADFTVHATVSDNRPGTTVVFAYALGQTDEWTEIGRQVVQQQSGRVSQQVSIKDLPDGVIAVRITATDAAGKQSVYTVEHTLDRAAPQAPTGLAVQAQNVTTLSVTWDLPSASEGVTSYQVYRRQAGEQTFSRRASGITQNGYTDTTCAVGTTYEYYVVAVDRAGNVSAASAAASGTTPNDQTPPEIVAVTPKSGSIFGPQQTIQVHARDDAGLDHVVVSWKTGDTWDAAQTMTLDASGKADSVSFTLREWTEGTYEVRAQAYDQAGNASAYSETVTYTLDKTAPVVSNVQAQADGDRVSVQWTSGAEADLAGFYVYRVSQSGTATQVGSVRVVTGQTAYAFTDTVHWSQGDGTYTYRVRATDRYGNESMAQSEPVEVTVPADTQVPTAVLSAPSTAFAGDTLTFSAAGSSDDREITAYTWDFGDQQTAAGKQVSHTYETGGTFTVTLRVQDGAGNVTEKTAVVEVTAQADNAQLRVNVYGYDSDRPQDLTPLRAQVVYDLGGENVWYRADADGLVALHTLDQGTVRLGAYCEGYLPGEASAVLVYGQQAEVTITLKKASVVTGTLESEELTYEQIKDLGIDTQAPENQKVYQFAAQIDIGGNIERYTYYVNEAADFVGPSVPIETVKVDDAVYTIQPHAVQVERQESGSGQSAEPVTIAYVTVLRIPGTVSALKQFFEAELTVLNQADTAFAMEDCTAQLYIPSGLTLIPTDTTAESAVTTLTAAGQPSGVIGGQQNASVKWILRGDQAGTYQLAADFDGVLADFAVPIHANFQAEEAIEVRQADEMQLNMYVSNVMLDRTCYVDLELSCDTGTVQLPRVTLGDYVPREIVVRQADSSEQAASGLTSLEPGQTLVYRYAIQIDEDMPLLFVSNLLEGSLQADGMTANTYTRNITKFKLFSGDFNLTEMGVFLKTLPRLSAQDATAFWQFLFNTDRTPAADDMYYRILTGDLEDCDQTIEELQIWILSMCQSLRARLNCYVQKSNESLGFLSQAIADSMWKKLESNGVTGEQALKEYAMKKVFNGMIEYFTNIEGISSEWVGKIQGTVIEANSLWNVQKTAKKLVDNMQLAMRTVGIILNSEYSARYAYFNYYLNQRIYHEHPGEADFRLLLDAAALDLQNTYWTSEALDTVTWITGKDSWTNHTDTIERWAETLYQFEVIALGYETDAQPDEPQAPDVPEQPDPEQPEPEDPDTEDPEVPDEPDDSDDQGSTGSGGASHPQASTSSASDRYEIDRPSNAAHGDVAVSSADAQPGDLVTVTVSPESGYGLEQLIVTGQNGEQITPVLQADGTYQFEMPVGDVEIDAVFRPVQDLDHQTSASFLDVLPTDWFAEAVAYMAQRGLMQGVSQTLFGAEQTMSRAMVWTVLARLDGADTDQTDGIWYQAGADWAMAKGISDGSDPNGAMTREQLVTMLYRYAGSPAASDALTGFTDLSKISDYAKEAMTWAVDTGLVSGMGDGTLAPQGTATRAQVAAILMRFCENIAK